MPFCLGWLEPYALTGCPYRIGNYLFRGTVPARVALGGGGAMARYVNGQRHDPSYEHDGLRAAIEARLVMA